VTAPRSPRSPDVAVRVVDAHCHVLRSEDHGRELWSYFLGRGPAHGDPAEPPAFHTVDEAERLMDETGVEHMNILMFTWAGRYWRDGQYTLPDGPGRPAAAEELRRRVVQRIVDNNEWAVRTCAERPRFSTFCGVDPALMSADEMLAEIADKVRRGAVGVKTVPHDSRVPGDDRRWWPVFAYLQDERIPILSEASGRPGAPGRPARYRTALLDFPALRLVFAHLGHDPTFGAGADAEVVDLAREFAGVHTDLSLRLPEMLEGACTPDAFAAHLRAIGTERVLYGTNFGFVDTLRPDPTPRPADAPQTTWAKRNLEAFLDLPLDDAERAAIAAGNWDRLTRRRAGDDPAVAHPSAHA
jgi:predicted TIM-barrel fold metal-dependent hydrolase